MNLLISMILSAVSLRGAARVMVIICSVLQASLPVPSWYTSRIWLLKLGYYKLTRKKEHANDWIWIIDHSVQSGQEKTFFVLGIRGKDLPKDRALNYADMEPIELLPVTQSNGKIIYEQLTQIIEKTGVPRAIVADAGSDLKCGINKFITIHTDTAYIYDIKHRIAAFLKKILEADLSWHSFVGFAAKARQYMHQSDIAALAPPNQRSKARYMNADKLVNWALRVLAMPDEAHIELFGPNKERGVGWLQYFKDDIRRWGDIIHVADTIVSHVEIKGLYRGVSDDLRKELPELPCCQASGEFQDYILSCIFRDECKVHIGERLPGSSCVLESVFGKFKNIENNQSSSGFTNLLLALPAIVADTSADVIKEAMESTKVSQVWDWMRNNIGKSVQAKRTIALSNAEKGTKIG